MPLGEQERTSVRNTVSWLIPALGGLGRPDGPGPHRGTDRTIAGICIQEQEPGVRNSEGQLPQYAPRHELTLTYRTAPSGIGW